MNIEQGDVLQNQGEKEYTMYKHTQRLASNTKNVVISISCKS